MASTSTTTYGPHVSRRQKASEKKAVAAPVKSSETFDATYNKVWAATVGAIADQGLPIQVVEKESGLITTQFVQFASGLLTDKQIDAVAHRPVGAGFLSIWSMARYSLSVHVTRGDDSTTTVVRVVPHIEAFESNTTHAWHVCETNGGLEDRLFASIHAAVQEGNR